MKKDIIEDDENLGYYISDNSQIIESIEPLKAVAYGEGLAFVYEVNYTDGTRSQLIYAFETIEDIVIEYSTTRKKPKTTKELFKLVTEVVQETLDVFKEFDEEEGY